MYKTIRIVLGIFFIIVAIAISSCTFFNPDKCLVEPPLECVEFGVTGDDGSGHGILNIKLKNNQDSTASYWFNAFDSFEFTETACTILPNRGMGIPPNGNLDLTCTYNYTFSPGEKYQFELEGKYLKQGDMNTTSIM